MSKTSFAMFLAGATVGAAATWLCLKRYYEQIAQEEIDSVKAAFAERKPVNTNIAKSEKSNEKQEENQHKADIAKLKPDLVNYAAKLQEEGYTNYTEHSKKNTEEKKDEPMILILLIAVLIYILCTADSTESCIPNEKCRTCPFPCDKRKN